MLDLAFVRDHLPLVEEKLRQRGMDPAAVLRDFHAIDLERRAAITEAETLKARAQQGDRRNRQAQERQAGRDRADQRDQGAAREDRRGREARRRGRRAAARHPDRHSQPARRQRAGRHIRGRQRRSAPLGHAAAVRLHAQAALGAGRRAGRARPGARRQDHRRAFRRVLGPRAPGWSAR